MSRCEGGMMGWVSRRGEGGLGSLRPISWRNGNNISLKFPNLCVDTVEGLVASEPDVSKVVSSNEASSSFITSSFTESLSPSVANNDSLFSDREEEDLAERDRLLLRGGREEFLFL